MSLVEDLKWRYATKAMNGQSVADEKINYILEAIRLAPTSSGLQQFEVYMVKDQALKEKIKPVANNQQVITQCSHLLIFAGWDNYTVENISKTFDLIQSERGYNEGMEAYRQRLVQAYTTRSAEENFNHTARQAYIAFGLAIAAAAEQKVDATPIEGFNAAELDKLLEFDKKGVKSVTLLPLGYRDEASDWLLPQKKVRRKKEDLIHELV